MGTMTETATNALEGTASPATARGLHELIECRWSPRSFADRPVPHADLRALFEAARTAPSCYNEQPWAFLVAPRGEGAAWRKIHACLVPGNQRWTGTAPVLMLTFARERFARDDRPNRHALHDLGQAMAVLTVEATRRGIAVHQMAGFDTDQVRESFAVPSGWLPVTAVALGYPDEERPERKRKPLEEIVFAGDWGERPAWLTRRTEE